MLSKGRMYHILKHPASMDCQSEPEYFVGGFGDAIKDWLGRFLGLGIADGFLSVGSSSFLGWLSYNKFENS